MPFFCGGFPMKKTIKIVENHLMNIPTKFGSNWPTGFRDNQHAKAYDEQR
jgi:hypothetical protein